MLTSLSIISHSYGGIILSSWDPAHLVGAPECLCSLHFVFIAKLDSSRQSCSGLPGIRWSAAFKADGFLYSQLKHSWEPSDSGSPGDHTWCYYSVLLYVIRVPIMRMLLDAILIGQKCVPNTACRLYGSSLPLTHVWALTTPAWKACFSVASQGCIYI